MNYNKLLKIVKRDGSKAEVSSWSSICEYEFELNKRYAIIYQLLEGSPIRLIIHDKENKESAVWDLYKDISYQQFDKILGLLPED